MKFKKTLITAIAALGVFTFSSNDVEAASLKKLEYLTDFTITNPTSTIYKYFDGNKTSEAIGMTYGPESRGVLLRINVNSNVDLAHIVGYGSNNLKYHDKKGSLVSSGLKADYSNVTGEFVLYGAISDSNRASIYEIELYGLVEDTTPPKAVSGINYKINEDNSILFNFNKSIDTDFSHIEVYKNGDVLTKNLTENTLNVTDLLPEETYVFSFYAVDTSGNKSIVTTSTVSMPAGPDLIAPLDIKNLKHVARDTSIQFTYDLPIDSDFSHLMIYRNNKLIGDNVKIASFNDLELDYDTSYQYTFKAVDTSGNVSNGYTLTAKTMPYNDTLPPDPVTGLSLTEGNSSLYASWSPNVEPDVEGYNVYVNGKKRNASLISGNSYSITNLNNGNEYLIQVSAVDTNGNESDLSEIKSASPDKNVLPVIKLDNDLSSVGSSVENWFSEIWLIVAFATGLPLSFIVGNRIKSLFFA